MKYLIIGGVAGGATVAARLRRMDEQAEIILFERGAYVSYANCGLPTILVIPLPSATIFSFRQLRDLQLALISTSVQNKRLLPFSPKAKRCW